MKMEKFAQSYFSERKQKQMRKLYLSEKRFTFSF